jgi:CBS domain containing-hemolysin-like protein
LQGPESTLLINILRLRDLKVKDVITPRTVVSRLPGQRSIDEVFDEVECGDFSRIPIHGDDPEKLTGYVLKDDILLRAARGQGGTRAGRDAGRAGRGQGGTRLDEIRRDFLSVDENQPLTQMLQRLVEGRASSPMSPGAMVGCPVS